MKTAIYLRVSTDEQAERFGLDAQREKCHAMAAIKEWPIVATYNDDGISGTKGPGDRPGLAAMLAAGERGDFESVITYSIDRLGRQTKLVLDLAERIEMADLELVTVRENIDTSTAAGRMFFQLMAVLAEFERNTIVERTTNGRNARGRKDGERGGRVPLGYQRIFRNGKATGRLVIDPIGAALVREIFAKRDRGMSYQQIADTLNERGVETPRGGKWSSSAIYYVVQNEDKYRGKTRGRSSVRWPAIL